jgi:ATP phosphoribosyltransferase
MKPQNISQLVELGAHDAGFTGFDWIMETRSNVTEIIDLKLDPVRIVAAIPQNFSENHLMNKKIIVASEYKSITNKFLKQNRYDYVFIQTYGATEAYPPQDADMIIDNTATGRTLKEHGLKIIDTIMESSTRFIANRQSITDGWKREKIEELKMLFASVLQARERVMLEMNVPGDKLDDVVRILPCMRAPTVSPLHEDQGYAVKVAVRKNETRKLIPRLKKIGASDILEYEFRKVVL